jgi:hypothetical protein
MWYILVVIAFIVVGFLFMRGRSFANKEEKSITSSNSVTDKPRMTSRRKLKEILASKYYDTLTDWEKHFCNDVNKQKTGLTRNQMEKIDEIWDSINMHSQYIEECEVAFNLLKKIIEHPAFETLPVKEKKYMKKIYSEGKALGSYRIQRIRDVNNKLLEGEN